MVIWQMPNQMSIQMPIGQITIPVTIWQLGVEREGGTVHQGEGEMGGARHHYLDNGHSHAHLPNDH